MKGKLTLKQCGTCFIINITYCTEQQISTDILIKLGYQLIIYVSIERNRKDVI